VLIPPLGVLSSAVPEDLSPLGGGDCRAILSLAMKPATHHLADSNANGEDSVLHRIKKSMSRAGTSPGGLHLGIGDDAALFQTAKNCELVLTCDWFLEGTHFLRDKHPPDAVGWKCLARAVSDIAAMGGVPRCFLLSLSLPETHARSWLSKFMGGLSRAAARFGCVLAGGDTTRRQDILVNLTVVGEVSSGKAVLRSGAKPGDILFVSGRLGGAEFGLHLLRKSKVRPNFQNPLLGKHLYPEPRLALGHFLAEKRLASAMMDLSDGLSTDLPRLCAASKVGARVHAVQIPGVLPREHAGTAPQNPLQLALHGGDDYELLFTVPKRRLKQLPRLYQGTPLTAIGEITKGRDLLLTDATGKETPLQNRGWDPFRQTR
jgi:thiamine-monophosphate kinase